MEPLLNDPPFGKLVSVYFWKNFFFIPELCRHKDHSALAMISVPADPDDDHGFASVSVLSASHQKNAFI